MRRISLSAGIVCLTLATTGFAQPPSLAGGPAAPAGLDVHAVAPGAVRVSWKDESRDERWFRVETLKAETPEPGKLSYRTVAYVGAGATAYVHRASFEPGAAYLYRVSAFNDAGDSPPLGPVAVRIPADMPKPDRPAGPFDAIRVFLGHFPTARQLIFVFDAARTREEADTLDQQNPLDGLAARLTVTDIESRKTVLERTLDTIPWQRVVSGSGGGERTLVTFEQAVTTPELDGIYDVTVELVKDGRTVRVIDTDEQGWPLQFERRRFEWENNTHGVTDTVYPPFEPVRVAGRTVDVVLRHHVVGELGLFDSVTARGKELLAGPIALRFTEPGGAEGRWTSVSGRFVRTLPHEAAHEAEAVAGPVRVRTTSVIEYDGMMKVELELAPGAAGGPIEGLWLDIPVRREMARLQHVVVGLCSRRNPAGKLAPWSTASFVPYIWLGQMDRGLAWFADNERGFVVDGQKPIQEIVVEEDRALIRIHLVNTPTTLTAPRKIVFGLQASPTKPMPADFRMPAVSVPPHGGNNVYWAMRTWYSCRRPTPPPPTLAADDPDRDRWHIIDVYNAHRQAGTRVPQAYLDNWLETRYANMNEKDRATYAAHLRNRFSRVPPRDPVLVFLNFYAQNFFDPEWPTFQDEWDRRDFRDVRRSGDWTAPRHKWLAADSRGPAWGGSRIVTTKSFRDWFSWNVREWYARGLGIYDDNGYSASANLLTTAAFREPNPAEPARLGPVRQSWNLWDIRAYNKRNWLLLQQTQPRTEFRLMKSHHMTGDMLIPVHTWNTINLDLEWAAHGLFSPERLQAHAAGRQVGVYAHAHQPIFRLVAGRDRPGGFIVTQKDAPDYHMAIRADWGMHLLHDVIRNDYGRHPELEAIISEFGFGRPEATVFNYWQDNFPVKADNENVKGLAIENGGRWLIVLVSWNPEPVETALRLDRIAAVRAHDAESGATLEIAGNTVRVAMDRFGVRLLVLEDARGLDVTGGPDRRLPFAAGGAETALEGRVTRYGAGAETALKTGWSVVSAPAGGSVKFARADALATGAAFSAPGRYLLRVTVSDGPITAHDEVLVEFVE